MNPDCSRIHKYAVATVEGISDVLYSEEEATAYYRSKERHDTPQISAFHNVSIQHLVDHPDTIETYCKMQTEIIEAQLKKSPSRVDFTKRS